VHTELLEAAVVTLLIALLESNNDPWAYQTLADNVCKGLSGDPSNPVLVNLSKYADLVGDEKPKAYRRRGPVLNTEASKDFESNSTNFQQSLHAALLNVSVRPQLGNRMTGKRLCHMLSTVFQILSIFE
jgi:hypothetical protein